VKKNGTKRKPKVEKDMFPPTILLERLVMALLSVAVEHTSPDNQPEAIPSSKEPGLRKSPVERKG